jgi:hypothetical protein
MQWQGRRPMARNNLIKLLKKGMTNLTTEQKMYYALRMGMAMCFIGHGAFGIITKQIWCNYFAVFGIGHDLAFRLMPPLGILDIILGVIVLIYPVRIAVWWLVIWGVVTALLRPLSGEPFAEFIERAGNYGAPVAMLLLTGMQVKNDNRFLSPVSADTGHDERKLQQATACLRIIVFLLLAGHGWLNVIEKKALINQYALLGFSDPVNTAVTTGIFEIVAAFVVLVRPFSYLLLIIFIWKMSSELFYPHYTLFEWIERGGSYASVLALYFATRKMSHASFRSPEFNFSLSNH